MDDFYLFANCNFVPDRYSDVRETLLLSIEVASIIFTNMPIAVASSLRRPCLLCLLLRADDESLLLWYLNGLRTRLFQDDQHVRFRDLRQPRCNLLPLRKLPRTLLITIPGSV